MKEILDFCTVYYTTQLLRCAAFSVVLILLVMLLRKMLPAAQIFLRGMLWSLFLLLPFLGKLKMFYENQVVFKATWWLTASAVHWYWMDRLYMAGIVIAAVCIFGKRLCLCRTVAKMERISFDHMQVCVTDMHITPFTAGLRKPVIVIPKEMMLHYSKEELYIVVQHEKTHIRLGHLWCGFAWDILRCLFWVNPFLTICLKDFRADMEEICDKVCIQNSGRTTYEYGLVLLKTLKLLRRGPGCIPPAAAYAGEKDFAQIKRRLHQIAAFRPYRKNRCICAAFAILLMLIMMLFTIHTYSYGRCNETNEIMVGRDDGEPEIVPAQTQELSRMISYDDKYVYVKREEFERFLEKNKVKGEIWIVFGGFYKLPGLGGAAEACVYESSSKDNIVQIPYESIRGNWYVELLQWL